MADLERAAAAHVPRGFVRGLREKSRQGTAVIAEIKQASPSKGLIRDDVDAPALARELAAAGAAALSVLTEEKWFLGSLGNLRAASEATAKPRAAAIPCLRKDFIIDAFQIVEARAHHADAILLLVAALDDSALATLAETAYQQQLDVLCEVHNAGELDRALTLAEALRWDPAYTAIGVNSRDLHSFDVSLGQAIALGRASAGRSSTGRFLLVAESGISTALQIRTLRDAGYGAFLVGESLMRNASPGLALRELIAACG
jgi:indole-3-glycerol phosphate synthase